jgi:hypothetical protein
MLNVWDGDPWHFQEVLVEIDGANIINLVYLDWKKISNSGFKSRQGVYSSGYVFYSGRTGEYGHSTFSYYQAYIVRHDVTGTFGSGSCMTSYSDPDLYNIFTDTTSTKLIYAGISLVSSSDKGWEMNDMSSINDFWDVESSFSV